MSESVLENYIIQHIQASPEDTITFSWHGGEPTLLGLEYFKQIIKIQKKNRTSKIRMFNGIQTNGTLLNDSWCRFLSKERFMVGLSLDGPKRMHDRYRKTKDGRGTHDQALRGYYLLQKHEVPTEILCVVNSYNVQFPLEVYRFFKQINAKYITFLPLVEQEDTNKKVSNRSVPSEAWGEFLCSIFDEWAENDIGRVKVQIFEEAARTAFDQEHSLCIFRPTCGNIPVIEHNGDFYSCDHYVDAEYKIGNINERSLLDLLESPKQRTFGENKLNYLPLYCQKCNVRVMCNGGCPKNRIISTLDGEAGLNYLCTGYKRFFNYCLPFVTQVAALVRAQEM
jgi:uncharacterized protein